MDKAKKPKKCCYNCKHSSTYAVPREDSPLFERVIKFNLENRFCLYNVRVPYYKATEKRSCKGYEVDEFLPRFIY